jgi:AraC-like DNA-binding protein
MYSATEDYGKVRMNSYIPSQSAKTYLNYYLSAGWHKCNQLYNRSYSAGYDGTLLLFTISGCGILLYEQNCIYLKKNTVAIVPPGAPMRYFTCPEDNNWEFYWITLSGSYPKNVCRYIIEKTGGFSSVREITSLTSLINSFIETDIDSISEWELSNRISILLGAITNILLSSATENKKDNVIKNRILQYIEQKYSGEIHLSDLSRLLYISKNQLIRIFERCLGYSPYQYIKHYRLLKVRELLQMSNKDVREISTLTGFSSSSHLIRQFKAEYGVTPNVYRNSDNSNSKIL